MFILPPPPYNVLGLPTRLFIQMLKSLDKIYFHGQANFIFCFYYCVLTYLGPKYRLSLIWEVTNTISLYYTYSIAAAMFHLVTMYSIMKVGKTMYGNMEPHTKKNILGCISFLESFCNSPCLIRICRIYSFLSFSTYFKNKIKLIL